jgi:hypothetical protein
MYAKMTMTLTANFTEMEQFDLNEIKEANRGS